MRKKIPGFPGPSNPRWKGGRWLSKSHGYIFVLCPGHPNARKNGYVREHVKVMADHLGRKIEAHETVHHINGDKLDNRLENLEVMTRAEHASHHHKGLMKPNSLANLKTRQKKHPVV